MDQAYGVGHSLGAGVSGKHVVCGLDDDRASLLAGSILQIYVETSTGALMLSCSATMTRRFFIWLEFTGPFDNS